MTLHPTFDAILSTFKAIQESLVAYPVLNPTVHVERKYRNGSQVWPAKVLVVPAGETRGEYYAIYREQTIDALKDGLIDCEDLEIWEDE